MHYINAHNVCVCVCVCDNVYSLCSARFTVSYRSDTFARHCFPVSDTYTHYTSHKIYYYVRLEIYYVYVYLYIIFLFFFWLLGTVGKNKTFPPGGSGKCVNRIV